jgi:hypothetical protein
MTMKNRKILMQKDLKLLKVLSTGDKTEIAEDLYASTLRSTRYGGRAIDCVLFASGYCGF